MRVVVTGATGNVGTSVIEALGETPEVEQIVGVARRLPSIKPAKTTWVDADIVSSDLETIFTGADAVIHLAWAIQPSHDSETLERINLDGRRTEARLRIVGWRLLLRAQGPRGHRGLADRRHQELLLLTPQGAGRGDARRLRS